jgi:hypothetical protein
MHGDRQDSKYECRGSKVKRRNEENDEEKTRVNNEEEENGEIEDRKSNLLCLRRMHGM